MESQPPYEGRERLLLGLVRALLSLAGERVAVSVIEVDAGEPLSLRGVLCRPYRQPFDPGVITLGFALNRLRLDVHLHEIADLRRWDFRVRDEQAVGVLLILTDGTIIQIDQASKPAPPRRRRLPG